MDWLAAMTSHISNQGKPMVCCYGFYSNVSRRTSSKRKVRDIRKSWMKACDQAGIPGMLFHDFDGED